MIRHLSQFMSLSFAALALAACSDSGWHNPFQQEQKHFVATAVPADFAVVIDENHDTYVTRQHIQQVITAADSISRTTYSTFSDYNNSVRSRFTQETPLTAAQIQAMWNDVAKYRLLEGSSVWINWASEADLYKHNDYIIQIRANGKSRTYHQANGFSGPVRPLMLLVQAVRLPISQDANTPVVGAPATGTAPATAPATQPAPANTPATAPATAPASHP